MIKQLKTLIKASETALNERRLELVALQEEESEIISMQHQLAEELEEQRKIVSENPDFGVSYDAYYKSNVTRRATLDEYLIEARQKIAAKEDEVAEAYRELKKYEITLERKQEEQRQEQERKDQATADDQSAQRFLRDQ